MFLILAADRLLRPFGVLKLSGVDAVNTLCFKALPPVSLFRKIRMIKSWKKCRFVKHMLQ